MTRPSRRQYQDRNSTIPGRERVRIDPPHAARGTAGLLVVGNPSPRPPGPSVARSGRLCPSARPPGGGHPRVGFVALAGSASAVAALVIAVGATGHALGAW